MKSPLLIMTQTTPTDYWSDTCNTDELAYALEHGAAGATTNPTIVHTVLKQQINVWEPRVRAIIKESPKATEEEIAWKVTEEVALAGSAMLKPVYDRTAGKKGRIAMQINPRLYRNAEAMVEQARYFHSLADNITVKFPATAAGIVAEEEATFHGVSVTSTVSFTVPQVIAAAEAIERGLDRRLKAGKSIETMSPNCVVMVGRLDDWLKVVADKENIISDPGCVEWAGVAVMKKAYQLFEERNYRSRLMAAAYRNHYHWSEFIGGDVVTTIPYRWALRFNGSDVEVRDRIHTPVDPAILDELSGHFADFRRAIDENGMKPAEFDSFGSTARTLRTFIGSYDALLAMIRDYMIPNPDR